MGYRLCRLTNGTDVKVDEDGAAVYGLPCGKAVTTRKGPGTIVGGNEKEIYVLLTADLLRDRFTAFPVEEVGDGVVLENCTLACAWHPLKTINFRGYTTKIIMQSKEGPCPIFAVANALALQGKLQFESDDESDSIRESTLNAKLCEYYRSMMKDCVKNKGVLSSSFSSSGSFSPFFTKSSHSNEEPAPLPSSSNTSSSVLARMKENNEFPACQRSSSVNVIPPSLVFSEDSKPSPSIPCASDALCTEASTSSTANHIANEKWKLLPKNTSISLPNDADEGGENSSETGGRRHSLPQISYNSNSASVLRDEKEQGAKDDHLSVATPHSKSIREKNLSNFLHSDEFDKLRKKCAEAEPSSPESIESLVTGLYSGMDLDVVFSGVEDFRMDREVVFFSLFGLRVFHGWVIGEYLQEFKKLQFFSYNDLTTTVVSTPNDEICSLEIDFGRGESSLCPCTLSQLRDSSKKRPLHDTSSNRVEHENENEKEPLSPSSDQLKGSKLINQLATKFYQETISLQMTLDGYNELLKKCRENEVAVLFWQNHFFTLTRIHGRLLVLLTVECYRKLEAFVFGFITSSLLIGDYCDGEGEVLDKYVKAISTEEDFSVKDIKWAELFLRDVLQREPTSDEVLQHLKNKKNKNSILTTNADLVSSPLLDSSKCSQVIKGKIISVTPQNDYQSPKLEKTIHVSTSSSTDDENAVKTVQSMFPNLSWRAAQELLIEHNYDLPRAVESLLNKQD